MKAASAASDASGAVTPGPLWMYPRLDGYQLYFKSTWDMGNVILMQQADMLKKCPAGQVWPWCAGCKRFLLPAESHRLSRRHVAWQGRCSGMDPQEIRANLLLNLEGENFRLFD